MSYYSIHQKIEEIIRRIHVAESYSFVISSDDIDLSEAEIAFVQIKLYEINHDIKRDGNDVVITSFDLPQGPSDSISKLPLETSRDIDTDTDSGTDSDIIPVEAPTIPVEPLAMSAEVIPTASVPLNKNTCIYVYVNHPKKGQICGSVCKNSDYCGAHNKSEQSRRKQKPKVAAPIASRPSKALVIKSLHNQRMRERYQTDPEYRQAKLIAKAAYRERNLDKINAYVKRLNDQKKVRRKRLKKLERS